MVPWRLQSHTNATLTIITTFPLPPFSIFPHISLARSQKKVWRQESLVTSSRTVLLHKIPLSDLPDYLNKMLRFCIPFAKSYHPNTRHHFKWKWRYKRSRDRSTLEKWRLTNDRAGKVISFSFCWGMETHFPLIL